MRLPRFLVSGWIATLACAAKTIAGESLVLANGRVYTANDRHPRAEAVVVENAHILFVGSAAEARQLTPPMVGGEVVREEK
jgi:hypothetical protein